MEKKFLPLIFSLIAVLFGVFVPIIAAARKRRDAERNPSTSSGTSPYKLTSYDKGTYYGEHTTRHGEADISGRDTGRSQGKGIVVGILMAVMFLGLLFFFLLRRM